VLKTLSRSRISRRVDVRGRERLCLHFRAVFNLLAATTFRIAMNLSGVAEGDAAQDFVERGSRIRLAIGFWIALAGSFGRTNRFRAVDDSTSMRADLFATAPKVKKRCFDHTAGRNGFDSGYLVYLNTRAAGKGSVKTIDLCDQKTAPLTPESFIYNRRSYSQAERQRAFQVPGRKVRRAQRDSDSISTGHTLRTQNASRPAVNARSPSIADAAITDRANQ
jgi:hypothetical protein